MFKNDKPDGIYMCFWSRIGIPQLSGKYVNGLREGKWESWDVTGVLSTETEYSNDEVVSVWEVSYKDVVENY
jgi:antitoxin component YwqK of YwqJK toxin-antitoxin module